MFLVILGFHHKEQFYVTWGFRDAKSLKESGADFLVDSPAQLLDIAQNTECETAL